MRKYLIIVAILALLPFAPRAAGAAGQLVKGTSFSSIYYVADDGKRYVFPNDKTFLSWYPDFSGVTTVADADLASYPIGGNVTYKPGVKLVKVQTDPKTYAVDAHGTLRWVETEAAAAAIYGADWAKQVDDIPDMFFTNYKLGTPIASAGDYDASVTLNSETDISADKVMAESGGPATTPVATTAQPTTNEQQVVTQAPAGDQGANTNTNAPAANTNTPAISQPVTPALPTTDNFTFTPCGPSYFCISDSNSLKGINLTKVSFNVNYNIAQFANGVGNEQIQMFTQGGVVGSVPLANGDFTITDSTGLQQTNTLSFKIMDDLKLQTGDSVTITLTDVGFDNWNGAINITSNISSSNHPSVTWTK